MGKQPEIYVVGPLWAALIVALVLSPVGYAEDAVIPWVDIFAMREPVTDNAAGICAVAIGALPEFTVRPDAPGTRLVHVSLPFAEQQSLAANMIQLGYSWYGYNAWDDIRSAEFLAGLPEVAPERVAAMGRSMGAYRAWQVSAATDVIKAGAAICWMGDLESFMVPDQNQTTGQSAFSMIHPGLLHYLDYPDVASIACPKPMLFFAGTEDTLFPMDGVERSFEKKMRDVWRSQDAEDQLLCKAYDVPHLFNVEMQEEAFQWLDEHLKDAR